MHLPFLERASQPGNKERAHALGAFLTLRAIDRIAMRELPAQKEGLAYQVRAAASYLDELQPQTKEVSHLREIIRVSQQALRTHNVSLIWSPLLAFAYWLENDGQLAESLDVLETTLRLKSEKMDAEEMAAHLQQGRVLRNLGRFQESTEAYVAAATIARECGDFRSEMVSRIGRATISQMTGDLPGSVRDLKEVLQLAEDRCDKFVAARASHGLAVSMHRLRRPAEAIALAFQAFEAYEEPPQRARALGDTGTFLKELGHYSAAREAFVNVLAGQPPVHVRANTVIELIELSGNVRDRVGFERWRRDLEPQVDALPPEMQVDYSTKVGNVLCEFGRRAEAKGYFQKALTLAEKFGFGQQIFELERLITELEKTAEASVKSAPAPEPVLSPELQETVNSLFALRSGA